MLSGERAVASLHTERQHKMRLITTINDDTQEQKPQNQIAEKSKQQNKPESETEKPIESQKSFKPGYIDLIHETLVRARPRTDNTQKPEGYWPTLYRYLEENPDRGWLEQQLRDETGKWQRSNVLGKVTRLCSYSEYKRYRKLNVRPATPEKRFLTWSKRMLTGIAVSGFIVLAFIADNIYWAKKHDFPLEVELWNPLYRLGYKPSLPEMVAIPAGRFMMGDEDIDKIPIEIKKPFQLGQYEVTYKQYDYYVWTQQRQGHGDIEFPKDAPGGRSSQPVVNVSFHDATAYVAWLGNQIDAQCRLPTEYEWEYAARAGTDTAYYWGDDVGVNNANCDSCGSKWDSQQAAPIGQFKANPFGLHDMLGNVWKWTCSEYGDDRSSEKAQQCPKTGSIGDRVLRGGSWGSVPGLVRASARVNLHPDYHRISYVGFRVLCLSPIE